MDDSFDELASEPNDPLLAANALNGFILIPVVFVDVPNKEDSVF